MEENIECGGFTFFNKFDSANLDRVEAVEIIKTDYGKVENNKSYKNTSMVELPCFEFNIWTKPDCHGTEFQNNNKTWFYFGIKASVPGALGVYVKLNLVNLNKHVKMFSQGMCPVFKIIPGHPQWDRIKDKPTFTIDDRKNELILSFTYRTSENPNAITYFAFTYPFSYTDLQKYLKKIDTKMLNLMINKNVNLADDIYYHRENAINSLEGRRLDILTISSYYNILTEREAKIRDLFPNEKEERPFKFKNKKIIFMSARVHPGETPSSFVLNGFINLLLNREDQIATILRQLYVFKLIPMLNPDGVAQGYYRMDTRGINLNRLYLDPSKTDHPTIFAAKTLLRYYHNSYSLPDIDYVPEVAIKRNVSTNTSSIHTVVSNETNKLLQRVTQMSREEKNKVIEQGSRVRNYLVQASEKSIYKSQDSIDNLSRRRLSSASSLQESSHSSPDESGIFLYIDFHSHASKKGIFIYGNHFKDPDDSAACMLLPKLMSINNQNFHFTSCNFTEKNMYLIDKRDGMSREGSGRVAVYKLTGLINSYTLECNYNTGRLINTIPPRLKDGIHKNRVKMFAPPKYNPALFEEVGAAFGPSILDMTGSNPNSRLPNSQYRSLKGLKSYLKLISTNHYERVLNEPFQKSLGDDRYRFSQSAAVDSSRFIADFVMKPYSTYTTKYSNNTYKLFRTGKIYGPIQKKIKARISRQSSLTISSSSSLSNKGRLRSRSDSKIRLSKIMPKKLPKRKVLTAPSQTKIVPKKHHQSPLGKERSSKIKLPVKKKISSKKSLTQKPIKPKIKSKSKKEIGKAGHNKISKRSSSVSI